MSEAEFEKLTVVNGIQASEDGQLIIEIGFDGQVVTFRGESGEIEQMGTLCYIHFILLECFESMTDEYGELLVDDGITPGHVISHLIDHLHTVHHQLTIQQQLAEVMKSNEDGTSDLIKVLKVGADGIEEISVSDLAKEIADSKDESADDDDEITVHGSPREPHRTH